MKNGACLNQLLFNLSSQINIHKYISFLYKITNVHFGSNKLNKLFIAFVYTQKHYIPTYSILLLIEYDENLLEKRKNCENKNKTLLLLY